MDFLTDVLMIVGTAIILVQIDPMLALAAPLPFPLIAYLVYKARIICSADSSAAAGRGAK